MKLGSDAFSADGLVVRFTTAATITAIATATVAATTTTTAATISTPALTTATVTAIAAGAAEAATFAAAATTTAAEGTVFTGTGLVDRERTTVHGLAVEHRDCVLRFLIGRHGDEREAARFAGEFILHEQDFVNNARLGEEILKVGFRRRKRQIADVEFSGHITYLLYLVFAWQHFR